jgi:hypothetical protein
MGQKSVDSWRLFTHVFALKHVAELLYVVKRCGFVAFESPTLNR